jgi:tRNA wybutosine-synthesizing protein 1
LERVTQLYLSIDAPTKKLLKEVDKPLFKDYWERMNTSLEYCSQRNDRTCIRLTLIKDVNDIEPEKYAELIIKGNPDFIEIKAYMHIGASRTRLKIEHMPWHEDVVGFTKKLIEYLPDYEIVSEHIPSRVVMCAKKAFRKNNKWRTWIDFSKWQKLIESGKDFNKFDFLKETPETGLSGRIIRKEVEEKLRKKGLYTDENIDEIELG